MLCSKCSEHVKPIVAVDIDGTLGDYHGHFVEFSVNYFDYAIGAHLTYKGDRPFSEWWMEEFDRGRKDWHDVKLAYRQGGMKRTMPIRLGAQALCWAIRDAGAELWLTTTRPYLSLDNVIPDTVEWLRRNDIQYDGLLFDELKYEQFAERVDTSRVVAVLDDLTEMCEAAGKVLHYGYDAPILIVNPYNRAMRWPVMCDLDSACDIVLARIRDWKENYGQD